MQSFLSIDVGTSSTKLTLISGNGELIATVSSPYAVNYPHPDWAEQDPNEWWKAICKLTHELTRTKTISEISAISVSGQAPSCLPVDFNGNPLRRAIVWLDRRSTTQVDWLREHIGEEHCRAVSLNRLDSYFGGVKWLWFRQNEPEAFAQTWKILQANGYVLYKLTGRAVIDPSQAGLCSPCFNQHAMKWDEEICEQMGIPLNLLPEICHSYEVIGQVSGMAAEESGLPKGVPVVCGGGDFACSCLSTGAAGRGEAALMLGTAGNLLFPGLINEDSRLLHTIHLTGEPLPFGGVLAGENLNWFADLFGSRSIDFFRSLDHDAAKVPAGCEGLLFLPYLMGERTPIWDAHARGAFIGFSSRHTRAHLYRSILEGVAFAFRQIAEIAEFDKTSARIVAIDGGSRSSLWRSILASVIGSPILEGGERSGTALGSAFLAAYGAGLVRSFKDLRTWTQNGSLTEPDQSQRQIYNQLHPVYCDLYVTLKQTFSELARNTH